MKAIRKKDIKALKVLPDQALNKTEQILILVKEDGNDLLDRGLDKALIDDLEAKIRAFALAHGQNRVYIHKDGQYLAARQKQKDEAYYLRKIYLREVLLPLEMVNRLWKFSKKLVKVMGIQIW